MPSRGGQQGSFVAPYRIAVSYGGAGWFGPLDPPAPIAPPGVAGRQWDYPSGYNLNTTPRIDEPITFAALRGLADGYDLLRLVIETRKDQVARLGWSIKPRDATVADADAAQIQAVSSFLRRPDGVHPFADWLRLLLEDLFVIDAPALYMQRDRGGKLLALLPLDGATIKPVIDDWGRTPQPFMQNGALVYPTAYQQVLKGYPAVDYCVRDVLYRPRNIRVNKAYGFGPVEQIVATVSVALRKQLFTFEYYTSGNIPDSLIGVPEAWTPDQIASYQTYWDAYIEGDLGRRRKAKFVPGGVAKTFIQTKEPELKSEFDEWLARICCFAFSVSPQALVKQMNRAAADTQKESAEEEGLRPVLNWVKHLIDDVIEREFNAPQLEFCWGQDQQIDPAQQATILSTYVQAGVLTINEARQRLGQAPLPDAAANQPMTLTASGYVGIGAGARAAKQSGGAAPEPRVASLGPHPEPRAARVEGAAAIRKFNPYHVPAGNGRASGEFTSEDGSGSSAGTPNDGVDRPGVDGAPNFGGGEGLEDQSKITEIDFSEGFHDAVVDHWAEIFQQQGVQVLKGVGVRMIGTGGSIVGYLDMLVGAPGEPAEAIEVKTGKSPTFTANQAWYIPMLQLGGHLYSTDPRINQFGLTPGEPFPPMNVHIIYASGPGQPYQFDMRRAR